MKNPMTPAGIKPATFRFVAQHLNHCVTVVPHTSKDLGGVGGKIMLHAGIGNEDLQKHDD